MKIRDKLSRKNRDKRGGSSQLNSRLLYAILPPISIHLLPENLESDPITAKIVFHDPIPRGECTLVVSTRCGDGRDYALRHIGHPVTVP